MSILPKLFGKRGPKVFDLPSQEEKSAIVLLGVAGNFDGLAKVLKSKNPHVRATVAAAASVGGKTVGTGGGYFSYSSSNSLHPRALQLLAAMLKDQDQEVRDAAEKALEEQEDPSATKLLADYRSQVQSTSGASGSR